MTLSRGWLELTQAQLARFEGAYGEAGSASAVTVKLEEGVLTLVREAGRAERLTPISSTRFGRASRPGARIDFEVDQGRAVGLTLVSAAGERTRLTKRGQEPEGALE